MASWKVHEIIRQSVKTFGSPYSDLSALIPLVNKLSKSDLPLRRLIHKLDYQPLYSDNNVVIGVFLLKEGHDIPLHDHPGMHGLLKVLRGVIEITSYSLRDPNVKGSGKGLLFYDAPLPAVKEDGPIVLSENDDCSVVSPVKNNIHRVACLRGPAAFLDILSPPYANDMSPSNAKSCHYFKEYFHPEYGLTLLQIPDPTSDDENESC